MPFVTRKQNSPTRLIETRAVDPEGPVFSAPGIQIFDKRLTVPGDRQQIAALYKEVELFFKPNLKIRGASENAVASKPRAHAHQNRARSGPQPSKPHVPFATHSSELTQLSGH